VSTNLPRDLDERLELAISGIRNLQIPGVPLIQVDFPVEPVRPILPGDGWWRAPVVRRAAGTALLSVLLGVILLNLRGGGAGVVLAEVMQSVVQAKSVSFVMKEQTNGKSSQEFRCWLQEDQLRIEGPGENTLIESGKGAIRLDQKNKQWAQVPTSTAVRKEPIPNPIEQLRQAKSDKARFVGKEKFEGRQTDKFQMPIDNPSLFHDDQQYGFGAEFQLTVWVDVESRLPLRIEIRHPQEPACIVFEQMKWNEKLNASLFDTTIPAGYSEKSKTQRDR
jgi:outer membrane lipoprotein-sorting protein